MSSTKKLISLEEWQPMRALVVDFVVATIDWKNSNYRLLSGIVEAEFQHLEEESKKLRLLPKNRRLSLGL